MAIAPTTSAIHSCDAINLLKQKHLFTKQQFTPPFPEHLVQAIFGMGCFWGVERKFWQATGVFSTAVGYAGGHLKNPTYADICTGSTAHAEVVQVIFDPEIITYVQLLQLFWESHNPTQGMRQGNDVGSQYRSVIYTLDAEQNALAVKSKQHYQQQLTLHNYAAITTEIKPAPIFYYAELYHQQYLVKNPQGYCGLQGLAVKY